MNNPELAYLLGMIVGKGYKIQGVDETEYRIEIPHKLMKVEGMDAILSVKASLLDIKQRLDPLIDTKINVTSDSKSVTLLSFKLNNSAYLARELNRMLTYNNYKDFRIPTEVFNAAHDIKLEFLRGLADVTAHARKSNLAFGDPAGHRVYIEIPDNWYLVVDICNLLKDVDTPVQTINWGHPNFRDPNLKDYKQGKEHAWAREHQIKIYADVFEAVGFNIEHKKRALELLANTNRQNWAGKRTKIEQSHHKFYWEKPERSKKAKPVHPMIHDHSIPAEIRGQNFNSWIEVAKIMGYQP
ncbi:hypothetical protein [Calidifontibacillus oryziterrae]|uniref:hypothetical protein n=1 Tax=Calidifontibacillus oryziterrae TaxID=1191699 RepID=UPI0003060A66|nr:hypothetical protein [Calidifontibacillus oryziterrae]